MILTGVQTMSIYQRNIHSTAQNIHDTRHKQERQIVTVNGKYCTTDYLFPRQTNI